MTEKELITGCCHGDRKCQKAIFDLFSGKMMALCLRYVVNRDDAQDVLQDSFIKLFRNIHTFRFEGSFEGWVRRIFVTTAITFIRSRQLHMAESVDNHYTEFTTEPDTLDKLENREIQQLICSLPNGYRIVFNLFALEGYSHKEISKMLHISENTSRTQYMKARLSLQTKIKKLERNLPNEYI